MIATAAQPQRVRNFVGGSSADAADGRTLDDVAPATGQVVATIPRSSAADVDAAVRAARSAWGGAWGRTGTAERAALLDRVADRIEARIDEFARIEAEDTGKPVNLAKTLDIPRAVANFRFFAGAVRHQETACHPMDGALNYTLRRPLGVAALITPWNLPLYLLSWKAAPALAMGNAVVCKPSEMTPRTASLLAEVVAECGAPAGAFNVVHGLGPECGQALVDHPDVAAISFTGGTATGRRVAGAASRLVKLSLELGGKNPTLVFADCDREATLDGVLRASFANQGQICLCGERLVVERSIAADFTSQLAERARALRIGDPLDPQTQFGSLISIQHREKVEGYVALAQEEGARLVGGGHRPQLADPALAGGAFFEPTILSGAPADARCAQEEIFGPVVTVHPFDTEEEALALANGVRYGLCASVWTKDLGRAHRLGERIQAGMVWVNCWLLRDLRVPFGGSKDSGVGREGGRWSLEFFSESRNVCIRTGP
jgi:aminomuconate-semialdehyde/2-hydroxymuconate-6-semialdehyde dehydrogenase